MPPPLALLFDGDDTLWENNAHFERAIAAFEVLVTGDRWSPELIRAELDRIEEADFARGGVGASNFGRHLRQAAAAISDPSHLDDVLASIDEIVSSMQTTEVELLPGVEQTLSRLSTRHRLGLVTRGDTTEQWKKIDSSGLRSLFKWVAVVANKSARTYQTLIDRWSLDPASSWMIGNSPRSDVIPARLAGLRAVYVPNRCTWHLELVDLEESDPGILTVSTFADLADLF